jgi:hypothetical protein
MHMKNVHSLKQENSTGFLPTRTKILFLLDCVSSFDRMGQFLGVGGFGQVVAATHKIKGGEEMVFSSLILSY